MTKASRPKRTRSAKIKPTTDVALSPAPAASDGEPQPVVIIAGGIRYPIAAGDLAAKAAKEVLRQVGKRFNVEMQLLQDANARKNAESARKDQEMTIVEDDAKQARLHRAVLFWVSLAGTLVAFGVADMERNSRSGKRRKKG